MRCVRYRNTGGKIGKNGENKMKAYLTRSIFTLIISLTFILPPPYLFVQPAYAGIGAQGASKDSQRLANYLKVIKGYLAEVKSAISTGDGGKEYIAEHYPELGDYLGNRAAPFSREYSTFKQKIASINTNFAKSAGYWQDATGSLAYNIADDGTSELFTYQKMGESPYEGGPVQGGYAQRSSVGQDAAKNYANRLRDRNSQLVAALQAYVESVEGELSKILQCSPGQKAPQELFKLAKEQVFFAYSAVKIIPKFAIIRAQKSYERKNDFYKAYADYYNACTSAFISASGSTRYSGNIIYQGIDTNGPSSYFWTESQEQGARQIDWTKYLASSKTETLHEWVQENGQGEWAWRVTVSSDPGSIKAALPNAVGGGFDIGEIKNAIDEGRKVYWWPYGPDGKAELIIPDGVRTIIAEKAANFYNYDNTLYGGVKSARAALVTKLNNALEKYKPWLPYSESEGFSSVPEAYVEDTGMYGVDGYYSISTGINGYIGRGPNHYPVITLSRNSPVIIPNQLTFTSQVTDPDNDQLEYRWVITMMPEPEEAKSSTYVRYQKISSSPTASIKPDLAGNWEVTLYVNDGYGETSAYIQSQAIRHILWIAHSDKTIALTDTGSDGKKYSYYLEASPDEAGMFLNYNDDGKPVDEDTQYQPPRGEGKYCFKICRDPDFLDAAIAGAYDGKFGSTNLVDEKIDGKDNPNIFRRELRLPVFKSAYGAKNKSSYILLESPVSLFVKVLDPQITDLVLSSPDCPYGRKISSPGNVSRLQATYDIEQWVDHDTWFNDHESAGGEGFLQFPGSNGVPDWMEKRAAEILNNYAEVLPYVEQIENFPDPAYTGLYQFGTKTIGINPGHHSIRYNSFSENRYGFFSAYDLDATARHEAFHSLYWHTVIGSKIYADVDTDLLPREGPFDYLLDSAVNRYGGYGPLIDRVKGEFSYRGDGEADVDKGKLKRGWGLFPVQDINRLANEYIQLPKCLPINIPVNLKMCFIMRKDSSRRYVEPQYIYRLINQKTPAPEIGIKFSNNAQWVKQIRKNEREGYIFEPVLYFNYTIRTPHEIQEYDASLIEPGDYTGNWR